MQIQGLDIAQTQRLKMSPQLYRSLKLMTLPLQELRLRMLQEAAANPALEIASDPGSVSLEELEFAQERPDQYVNELSSGEEVTYNASASDKKRRFIEGVLTRMESLQEHLMWQLRLQRIEPRLFRLGEMLIQNLDANGFHLEDPYRLVEPAEQKDLGPMLELIRGLDPIGTCVADYCESLLVQTLLNPSAPPEADRIIREFFAPLERGQYQLIAERLQVPLEKVQDALHFIQQLTPYPGREFSREVTTYVIPDLRVRIENDILAIFLNDEAMPVLCIDAFYERMSHEGGKKGRSAGRFARMHVRDARWFIDSVQQRNKTLLRVSHVIVDAQRQFFLKGPKHIAPLTLREVAADVGVHETTVSRITNSKYVETEWGIFPLKYFFASHIAGTDSKRYSKTSVKETIRELLGDAEGDTHKLSDQRISDILRSRGIRIARRTVAKYRHELKIGGMYERPPKM